MRRREPVRQDDRPEAPVWIRQWNFGRRHFAGNDDPNVIGGPVMKRWRQAQDDWCTENGCWQIGSRCVRPCGAAERKARQ